jgi:hypothetical protein
VNTASRAEPPGAAQTATVVHGFGVRHHGPGCARALVEALAELRPDLVLVEGPPEADALVGHVAQAELVPPVALLSYCVDDPKKAVYHPFAEFSPEWQALRWAAAAGVPLRFIDLPQSHGLALDEPSADAPAESDAGHDPLTALAQAAGHSDGEAWWNAMIEERSDSIELFAAIAEAMSALRTADEGGRDERAERDAQRDAQRDALREAHMRQCLRSAKKEGFARIALVCGAWHLPVLLDEDLSASSSVSAKADAARLKGLPKLKVQSTWVPWTYRHLTRASGYGAGIRSPGWYEHLWLSRGRTVATGWLARVARLMRERDLDCSSAHLIEATRLAESLAALRARSAPGLDELHEATRAVLTMGDDTVLGFIHDQLVVGDRLGSVPPEVPTVPLQRDLEQQQKTLRLKPEALQKTLDLDLRNATDLARSRLLHRLTLIDLPWGRIAKVGRSARGSFHEVWALQWAPEFALRLIEASRWGQTVVQAATARVIERCAVVQTLAELSGLVDGALLADLPEAVAAATSALQDRAALSGDVPQMLAALPALANVFRYGNVRQTDAAQVAHVLDGLIVRAAIGLPLAAQAIDDDAAARLRETLLAAHAAVRLREAAEITAAWQQALGGLQVLDGTHELLRGLATRLRLDEGASSGDEAATEMSLHLSSGSDAARAAGWLEGFLNRDATVLLHDDRVWRLLDTWLAGLSEEHFVRVLPLVRRSFATFGPGERRDLGTKALRHTGGANPAAPGTLGAANVAPADLADEWDPARAALAVPLLRQLLGLGP